MSGRGVNYAIDVRHGEIVIETFANLVVRTWFCFNRAWRWSVVVVSWKDIGPEAGGVCYWASWGKPEKSLTRCSSSLCWRFELESLSPKMARERVIGDVSREGKGKQRVIVGV